MTSTDKEEVEGSFDLKNFGTNIMHVFFYSSISEFAVKLEGMLD